MKNNLRVVKEYTPEQLKSIKLAFRALDILHSSTKLLKKQKED